MMRMRNILIALLSLMPLASMAGPELTRLTVEGRVNPVGIDVPSPRFGWQIASDANDVRQTSYRILVASSSELLARGVGDVWDSRTVRSDSSQWVTCKADALLPNRDYYWKVRVTTDKGRTSWSRPARWSTGMLSPANWRGSWIGLDTLMPWDRLERHSRLSVRYLRRTFATRGPLRRATIHISGLGNYVLYVNGSRVGEDVLTPVPTDYTKTVAYDTYDVTALLSSANAVGVALAGGHYLAPTQNYQTNVRTTYGQPRLMANLIVEYADGRADTIATDSLWRVCADGAVRYANGYDGELFDARKQLHGWALAGFDDSLWARASEMSVPGGALCGNLTPPMGVYAVERPASVRSYGRRHIVDFGTNGAGRVRLSLRAAPGDTVCVRHAELLGSGDSVLYVANLRGAEATARYVGDGRPHRCAPDFTYYGFRYAEITGVDSIAGCDIVRELIADRMDDAGTGFSAEEAGGPSLLNAIVANARRSVRSNYKGMPVDCPQRDERMPWLGDRTTGCLGESYLMDNHSLYAKWVADICDGQRADGRISDVTPAYWRLYNTNITWPAALPFACDMLYRQYGDVRPMRGAYPSVKRFLDMIRKSNYAGGLVPYDRYGDWCVPPESPSLVHSEDPGRKTDGRLISSAYYYSLCRLMQRYATMFGHAADARHYDREAATTLQAFNDTFLLGGIYSNGTVTANLLPLALGMVPDGSAASVADSLIATIVEKNDTHVSAGVIGIQWLMRYLSDIGRGDVAYALATTDTYPGWGYMVRRGATTIWELWNGDTANPSMNSGNHVMLLGDLLVWCYERLGGIRPDLSQPGFKHTVLKPDFSIARLSSVSASHPSPYGIIRSEWQRRDGRILWTVSIPANTTAEVHLPDGKVRKTGSGTHVFECDCPSYSTQPSAGPLVTGLP